MQGAYNKSLEYIPIWECVCVMARAATTSDVYNAIAEPQRRIILDLLATGEYPVNDMSNERGLKQPQVSKHLRVL